VFPLLQFSDLIHKTKNKQNPKKKKRKKHTNIKNNIKHKF